MKRYACVTFFLSLFIAAWPVEAQAPADAMGQHTIRIRFWEGGESSRQLAAVTGKQSRDLGAELRKAAREGKLNPVKGKFEFVIIFQGLQIPLDADMTVVVNGQKKPFTTTMSVEIVDGEGRLTFPARWISDNATLRLRPDSHTALHYPPPPFQELRTCSQVEVAGGGCGKWPYSISELANLVREYEASNYHFVK